LASSEILKLDKHLCLYAGKENSPPKFHTIYKSIFINFAKFTTTRTGKNKLGENFQANILGLQCSFWVYPAYTILLVTCFAVLSNPSYQSLQMELIPWQGMKLTVWLWAF
jgi:hypothetical protein